MEQAVQEAAAPASIEHAGPEVFSKPHHRTSVTLFYDPPYESRLDDVMARHLVAYLVPAASLTYKAAVWAAYSSCRFDFLIDLGTRRIAIDYTDTTENLETAVVEDNDALALGTGKVDVVLRVRRGDLDDRLYDTLHLLSKWEPSLFTPYGHRVFCRRASEAARCALPEPEADLATIFYDGESTGAPSPTVEDVLSGDLFEWPSADEEGRPVIIRRLSRERPGSWRLQYERASLVYSRGPIRRH